MPRVLFVFTSASKTLTGAPTGWYLPEAAHPYYVLAPHADIDFASPAGPNPPVDEASVQAFTGDQESVKFLQDAAVISKFQNAKRLADVKADDYDAIFYVGGHGPVLDLAGDATNINLVNQFWAANKITSDVCHGPASLVGGTDTSGKPIFSGRRVTGFSKAEEEAIGKVKDIPFLLEDKIKALGGSYEKAAEPWEAKVVVDGKLITGQNPASAGSVGQAILQSLKA